MSPHGLAQVYAVPVWDSDTLAQIEGWITGSVVPLIVPLPGGQQHYYYYAVYVLPATEAEGVESLLPRLSSI